MNPLKLMKAANSKSTMARAIMTYQRALLYYAKEDHWAVRGDDIVWIGDDDPTMVALTVLGKQKPRPVPGQKE